MKARREMFSTSDMASLELGEITFEDFVCQSLAAHTKLDRYLRRPAYRAYPCPRRAFICEALLWRF
jgi:hypothetical protein